MIQMLLRPDVADKIGRLYRTGVTPTAKEREEFVAARVARPKLASRLVGARPAAASDPENYAVVGSVAQITVDGVLSEEPDYWAWIYGLDGSTYEDIRDALALADADPQVKSVILDVSSPGGYVDGLFETLAAIEAFTKPITVQASEASSAAYAISAIAGPITAKGPASSFGSIGVASSFSYDSSEETIDVTSTEAPNKRPDPRTPEGKAVIVEYLDALHELFVDAIARGRTQATKKTYTIEQINAEFGRGATMLASAAKEHGLIDKLPKAVKRGSASASAVSDVEPEAAGLELASTGSTEPTSLSRDAGQNQKKAMDEATLKAQHPELYAALIASAEAQGVAKERKRVCAHLKLAESTGAQKVAFAAIASGASTLDEDIHAEYMSAALSRDRIAARQSDSDDAGRKVAGAELSASEGGLDLVDVVAARLAAERGKTTA